MGKEQFNQEILNKLVEFDINDVDTALLYLLSIFYGLNDSAIPEDIQKRVNLTKIVVRDYTKSIKANENPPVIWNIPLFIGAPTEPEDKRWAWVNTTFRKMFAELRADAKGDEKATMTKMKKFFMENPHVRIADVIKATETYLLEFKNGANVQYLQRADYFISKRIDGVITSRLSMYVEGVIAKQQQGVTSGEGRFMSGVKTSGGSK